DDILLECKTIFEDVHEDFYQIKNILSKFQDWREMFSESYYDAYISLCLPKLLNPLIRLQLLDWNPLENVGDLGQMAWYLDIEEFCCSKDNSETNLEDNPDHKVLSAVIEKTLLPKVSGFVEHVWDPLSSVQTDNLVHLCKTHVLENESSKAVQVKKEVILVLCHTFQLLYTHCSFTCGHSNQGDQYNPLMMGPGKQCM
ncbi:hypothetical protein FKM82_029680, partial [Ascaphus truei]